MKSRYVGSTKPFAIRIIESNLLLLRQSLSTTDQRWIHPLPEPSFVFAGRRRVVEAHQCIEKSWPTWPTSYFYRLFAGWKLANFTRSRLIIGRSRFHPEPSFYLVFPSLPSFCSKFFFQFCCHHIAGKFDVKVRSSSTDFDHPSLFIEFSPSISRFFGVFEFDQVRSSSTQFKFLRSCYAIVSRPPHSLKVSREPPRLAQRLKSTPG